MSERQRSQRPKSQRPKSQRRGPDERPPGAAPAAGTARTSGGAASARAATPAAADERALTRWLAGEMGTAEAAAFAARLETDPLLARAAARRRRAWSALERLWDAPGEAVPPGFAGRVMAHVRAEDAGRRAGRGSLSAFASRLAGAAALVVGLVVGLGLAQGGGLVPAPAGDDASPAAAVDADADAVDSDTETETAETDLDGLAAAYGGLYADLGDETAAGAGAETPATGDGLSGDLADDYTAVLAAAFAGEEGT